MLILFASAALGFFYTAVMEKGLFADPPPPALAPNTPALHIISPEEARSVFESGSALFIDARAEFDFNLGHIPGAMNLPLKDFDTKKSTLANLPNNKSLVTYCDGTECNSSLELAVKLQAEGFNNVSVFFGGWRDWQAMGLPTGRAGQ